MRLVGTTFCYSSITPVGSISVVARASRYDFSDGSVMASCSIDGASFGYNSVSMYRSDQVGATDAGCLVSVDVEGNGTRGYWSFSIRPGQTTGTATYRDQGSSSNNGTISMSCTRY